jgi:hypothetical protein
LADAAVDALNDDMRQVWHNQQLLEAEMRMLQRSSLQLCAQAQSWAQMYDTFHSALKNLGDVENLTETLHADVVVVSRTIRAIETAAASADGDVYMPLPPPTTSSPNVSDQEHEIMSATATESATAAGAEAARRTRSSSYDGNVTQSRRDHP